MRRSPKRILVVDDDHDFLESLQLLLIDDGHDAVPASGGAEAVRMYAEYEPDLVLLDFRMPGIDGYETFTRIMDYDADARIVFTSAYAIDGAQYREARSRSLAGMMGKPIRLADMRRAVRRHAK